MLFCPSSVKGILPFNTDDMTVKLLIILKIRENENHRLLVHPVRKEDMDRIQNLISYNPLQKIIFILEMIVKCNRMTPRRQ